VILTEKYTADGRFDKVKSRLVCDGTSQAYLDEIHSPPGKLESLVICLTTKRYRFVMTIDVKGAYLEAFIDD